MNNRTFVRCTSAVALGAVTFLGACRQDPLVVDNPNQPDIERALATSRLTETVISKLFQQMFNGLYNTAGDNVWTQAMVLAFETSSQLGNFGMGTRSIIPRPPIDNSIGNNVAAGNFREYDQLSRNLRSAANTVIRMNEFIAAGAGTGTQARDERALSFAWFNIGFALGHLSVLYDSAAAITPAIPADEVPALSHSAVVNATALAAFDSALAHVNSAGATTGTGGWPITLDWWNGPVTTGLDRATWIRIIRSHKAKFRAGVARTATERAAVNWALVIADATNGVTGDVIINANSAWNQVTLNQLATSASWSQMTPFILGMADTSGGYRTWLGQAIGTRTPFLLLTPDKRFPAGADRALQNTASGGSTRTGPASGSVLYFRHRPPGEDASNYDWGQWYYDNHRFWAIRLTGGNGPFALLSQAENDMLAAEGYLRTSQVALAVPLINFYRVRAGLPAIPSTTVSSTQVPGGAGCVPQVPVAAANPPTTVCGDVFEAMKWEKRAETAFTGHAQWFIDARGWNDLYLGTPLEWPVPYQETFARYGSGNAWTNTRAAPVGTYGFGRSTAY